MPFKSSKQRKACFATKGFNGAIDCHKWAHETNMKKQDGGPFNWRGTNRQQSVCPPGWTWSAPDNMCVQKPTINTRDMNPTITAPEEMNPDGSTNYGNMMGSMMYNPNAPVTDPGTSFAPKDPENQYINIPGQSKGDGKYMDPYFTMKGIQTGLAWLGNKKRNNRQDQYMYNQYTTLGQNAPVNVQDYQPNRFSMYAKYGGKMQKGGKTPKYNFPAGMNTDWADSAAYRSAFAEAALLNNVPSPLENWEQNALGKTLPNNTMLDYRMQRQMPYTRTNTNDNSIRDRIDINEAAYLDYLEQNKAQFKNRVRGMKGVERALSPVPTVMGTYQQGGRLVSQVPAGYSPVPGQPNYFSRTTEGQTRGTVQGGQQASNADWSAFLASPQGQQWQARQRQTDTVYTQPPVAQQQMPPQVQPLRGVGNENMWTNNNRVMGSLQDVVREDPNNLLAGTQGYQDLRLYQPMNDLAQPTGQPFPISRSEVFGTDRRLIPGTGQAKLDSSRQAYEQKLAMARNMKRMGGKTKSKYRG